MPLDGIAYGTTSIELDYSDSEGQALVTVVQIWNLMGIYFSLPTRRPSFLPSFAL